MGLRQDGRRRDGGEGGIAVDDGPVVLEAEAPEGAELVAVDEEERRLRVEPEDGALHPRDGGPEDVDAVNLLCLNRFHGPGDGFALDDGTEFVALPLRQLLRVVEERMAEIRREDHGGGIHRSGERPAAGLVAPGLQPPGFQEGLQFGGHADQSPRVATMTALMVCMRFSASSKTMLLLPSKTSSVTSTPSRPNFSYTSRPTPVSRLW